MVQQTAESVESGAPARPTARAVNVEAIPAELRALDRWCLWRYALREKRQGEKSWTKEPWYSTARKASSTNPATWQSFETVLRTYQLYQTIQGGSDAFDGIGFFMGDGWAGVDLDHVVTDSGAIEPWAAAIVERLRVAGAYLETSVSGFGVHAIGGMADATGTPTGRRKGNVEVYRAGRYLTVSGDALGAQPAQLGDIGAVWRELVAEINAENEKADRPAAPPPSNGAALPDDEELLRRLFASASGDAIRRLWDGDTSAHGDDHSAADLALCSHLAWWTDRDSSRIDRLFRQSGLYREKWDEHRGERTYGELTLARALEGCRGGYDPHHGCDEEPRRRTFAVGDSVRAGDRGNFGVVVEADVAGGRYRIEFTNPVDGNKRKKWFDAEQLEPAGRGDAGAAKTRPRWSRDYKLLDLAALEALKPPAWLVEGWIPAQSLTVLYGPSGGGKTFVALDLALTVAVGGVWHGHPTAAGAVVYAAGEGAPGLARRVAAWRSGCGSDPLREGAEGRRRVWICPATPQLLDTESVDAFLEAICAAKIEPSLLVVDTLARSLVGGDENSARDVGLAVDTADHLRRELGAAVVIVHHTGKDSEKQERGSSALRAGADVMLALTGGAEALELKNEKQKDAEQAKPLALALQAADLGLGPDGQPAKSCYVRRRNAVELAAEACQHTGRLVEILKGPAYAQDGASRTELEELLGLSRSTFHQVLTSAIKAGAIKKLRQRGRYAAIETGGGEQ